MDKKVANRFRNILELIGYQKVYINLVNSSPPRYVVRAWLDKDAEEVTLHGELKLKDLTDIF